MGFYDAAREHGLTIPDDIAVVGFDDQEVISAHLRPPLTTVALPHYELGAAGIRTLLGLETPVGLAPKRVACPPIRRDSV
jgi:LacI family transcriptional regulator